MARSAKSTRDHNRFPAAGLGSFVTLEDRITPTFETFTSLEVYPDVITAGDSIELVAYVSDANPDEFASYPPFGEVEFFIDNTFLGTAWLDPVDEFGFTSVASMTVATATFGIGEFSVMAYYMGEDDPIWGYLPSVAEQIVAFLPPAEEPPDEGPGGGGGDPGDDSDGGEPGEGPPGSPWYDDWMYDPWGDPNWEYDWWDLPPYEDPIFEPMPLPEFVPQPPVPELPVGGTSLRLSAVGADEGMPARVTVFNADGSQRFEFEPFGAAFTGGARVALGDLTGDGAPDLVVAPGPGMPAWIKAYDGQTGQALWELLAFEESFQGGAFVSTGDFNADGYADVVISPDLLGGPRVRVLDGRDGQGVLADFFGIADPDFLGGARTAVGDFNGNGQPDLAVVAGIGGGPRAALFNGQFITAGGTPPTLTNDFFVFEQSLRNGVYVAAGDLNQDGYDDLVVGGGPGGGPRVLALAGRDLVQGNHESVIGNFFAGDDSLRGGVRVAVGDANANGRMEILTGIGPGGPPQLQAFESGGAPVFTQPAFEDSFLGGVYVAGAQPTGVLYGASGATNPLGQTTIRGRFLPGAETRVIFSDQAGYRVEVPATVLNASEVRVALPVYVNPSTGRPGSAESLLATVVQYTPQGEEIYSAPFTQSIAGLPESNLRPGEFTQLLLEDTLYRLQSAGQDFATLDWLTDEDIAFPEYDSAFAPLIEDLQGWIAEIEQLQNGEISQANFGFGPGAGGATLSDLSTLDGILGSSWGSDMSSLESALGSVENMLSQIGQDIQNFPNQYSNQANALGSLMVGPLSPVGTAATLGLGYSTLMMQMIGGLVQTASSGIINGQVTPQELNRVWTPTLAQTVTAGIGNTATMMANQGVNWRSQMYHNAVNTAAQAAVGQGIEQLAQSQNTQPSSNSLVNWNPQPSQQSRLFRTWTATKSFGNSYTLTFRLTLSPQGATLAIQGPPNVDTPVGTGSTNTIQLLQSGDGIYGATGSVRSTWQYWDPTRNRVETKTEDIHFSGTLTERGELDAMIAGNLMIMR